MTTPLMQTRTLYSTVYPALKSVVIDHWCGGLDFTQRALAESMAEVLSIGGDDLARHLTPYLRRLNEHGVYTAQRAASGSKGAAMKAGHLTSPHVFNWSPSDFDTATLANVVAPYLSAPDDLVSSTAKSAFRSAIRTLLDLPTKCSDDIIVSAARGVDASRLYYLPNELYDRATAAPSGASPHTASNYRSALRAGLRYAAEHDMVAMIFPTIWPTDPWSVYDRYWPMAATGRTEAKFLTFRSAWQAYGDACRTLFGPDVHPDEITESQVAEAVRHVKFTQGRLQIGFNVRRALRDVAARFSEGPLKAEVPVDMSPYLRGPNGESGDTHLPTYLAILKAHGVPTQTRWFVRWYQRYITLDSLTILRSGNKYPARRTSQQLKPVTLQARLGALRLMLGIAITRLNIAASDLTPAFLFGEGFIRIVSELERWWLVRASTMPVGAFGSAKAGGVRQHVINLGQWALACYEKERHASGHIVASRQIKNGDRIDLNQERFADRSALERSFWESYRHASSLADALVGHAKGTKGKRGMDRANEMRNIKRMFRNTPPSWWIEILDALVDEVRAAKASCQDNTLAYHQLVLNTLTLGAYISTGCRDGELCHVRLDLQFSPPLRAAREIALRAIDRKNAKEHTVRLHREYVPDDVLDEYLSRSRPFFLARLSRSKPGSSKLHNHPFLLVNTEGMPYGCVEEDAEGGGRDTLAFKRRCGAHGQRFKQQFARIAVKLGKTVPEHSYEFSLHPIRIVCGYAIYQLLGVTAAANYLGDEPGQVLKSYAAIDGLLVNSATMKGLVLDEHLGGASARTATPAGPKYESIDASGGDYESGLERLLRHLENDDLDRQEFAKQKALLRARFGRAAA